MIGTNSLCPQTSWETRVIMDHHISDSSWEISATDLEIYKFLWSSHSVDEDKTYGEIKEVIGEHEIRARVIRSVDLIPGYPGTILQNTDVYAHPRTLNSKIPARCGPGINIF